MRDILIIALGAILVNNFVLVRFLGVSPFIEAAKRPAAASMMGLIVTLVMTLASAITYPARVYILHPFSLDYLQTIVFVLIIAALVLPIEMLLQKLIPALCKSLEGYLPLITTNCAVLGACLISAAEEYSFLHTVAFGCFSGLGFTLVIIVFSGVSMRLRASNIPTAMQGVPIALVSASLIALAFMGFQGMLP